MKSGCCKGLDVLLGPGVRVGSRGLVVGAAPRGGTTYLVMHIDNPSGLVEHEKGSGVAWLTNTLVPEFIENTIYEKVADELKSQFKQKGSTVTVSIVQAPPKGDKPTSDLKGGVFLGALLTAAGFGITKLVSKR